MLHYTTDCIENKILVYDSRLMMKLVETSQYQIPAISDETFHSCKITGEYQGVKKVMFVLPFASKSL